MALAALFLEALFLATLFLPRRRLHATGQQLNLRPPRRNCNPKIKM
jgi:hypothetical protein